MSTFILVENPNKRSVIAWWRWWPTWKVYAEQPSTGRRFAAPPAQLGFSLDGCPLGGDATAHHGDGVMGRKEELIGSGCG